MELGPVQLKNQDLKKNRYTPLIGKLIITLAYLLNTGFRLLVESDGCEATKMEQLEARLFFIPFSIGMMVWAFQKIDTVFELVFFEFAIYNVIKEIDWILKIIGFPLFAIVYGFDYAHYEVYFEKHIDYALMFIVGSGVGVAESVKQATETISIESSLHTIAVGLVLVCFKSVVGVVVTAIATWMLKVLSPYFKKRSDSIKKWVKNKLS